MLIVIWILGQQAPVTLNKFKLLLCLKVLQVNISLKM